MVATVGLLLLSVLFACLIPAEPAPDIDQKRFLLQVNMPRGTSLEGISIFARALEDRLAALAGVKGVFARVGLTEDNSFWNLGETAPEVALLEVNMSEAGMTGAIMDSTRSLLRALSASTVGIEYAVKPRGTSFEQILRPEANDIICRITGRDAETVERLADIFAKRIRPIHGLVDLRASQQEGTPEYRITVDREAASRHGLSVQAVAAHLIQHVRGHEATTLSDFDRKITVRVQPSMKSRNDINVLLASTLSGAGNDTPVRSLVQCTESEGFAELWRENQQRALVLAANVNGRSVGSVVAELDAVVRDLRPPPGYAIRIGGENEEIRESFEGLSIVILLSLFLVFMILAAEYESILYPLVILLTSPLAFVGAILAMVMTGQNFNVMSLVGLVIMIGAVDNDAVILVDLITALRRAGMEVHEAIRAGVQQRLRPILMTTATTVLGVIPLVFEFGTGSELVRALTTPLVGGLVASTLFTVTTIPVVYATIDRWGAGRKRSMLLESR
jgi:HAE1 family hydrophobic/amphiphilic exporter-1